MVSRRGDLHLAQVQAFAIAQAHTRPCLTTTSNHPIRSTDFGEEFTPFDPLAQFLDEDGLAGVMRSIYETMTPEERAERRVLIMAGEASRDLWDQRRG
jgi:hypothetical protein